MYLSPDHNQICFPDPNLISHLQQLFNERVWVTQRGILTIAKRKDHHLTILNTVKQMGIPVQYHIHVQFNVYAEVHSSKTYQ